jgi:hypothetical protein
MRPNRGRAEWTDAVWPQYGGAYDIGRRPQGDSRLLAVLGRDPDFPPGRGKSRGIRWPRAASSRERAASRPRTSSMSSRVLSSGVVTVTGIPRSVPLLRVVRANAIAGRGGWGGRARGPQ